MVELLPKGAVQPVRNSDSYRGDVVPPGEQSHVPVRLVR